MHRIPRALARLDRRVRLRLPAPAARANQLRVNPIALLGTGRAGFRAALARLLLLFVLAAFFLAVPADLL